MQRKSILLRQRNPTRVYLPHLRVVANIYPPNCNVVSHELSGVLHLPDYMRNSRQSHVCEWNINVTPCTGLLLAMWRYPLWKVTTSDCLLLHIWSCRSPWNQSFSAHSMGASTAQQSKDELPDVLSAWLKLKADWCYLQPSSVIIRIEFLSTGSYILILEKSGEVLQFLDT